MNIHKNARTTPKMRAFIAERHRAGETPRSISSAVGVSPATVRKWLRRFKTEGIAGLEDRSSRPHRLQTIAKIEQYTQIETLRRARHPFWKIAEKVGLSCATVARIGKSMGLFRLSSRDPKPQIIRYERSAPGEMIHIDIKKLGRIEGIGHRITGDRVGQSNPRSRVRTYSFGRNGMILKNKMAGEGCRAYPVVWSKPSTHQFVFKILSFGLAKNPQSLCRNPLKPMRVPAGLLLNLAHFFCQPVRPN